MHLNQFVYTIQFLLCLLLYMCYVDKNVAIFISKVPEVIRCYLTMTYMRIKLHPLMFDNPISRYKMDRDYTKFLKQYEGQ